MSTPEGKVKDLIKKLLDQYEVYPAKDAGSFPADACGWYYMVSQNAFGIKGIPDFLGVYLGNFWAIEAKAPGKEPTGFQALQLNAIAAGTGAVFVVDGAESLLEFKKWLEEVRRPWSSQ